MNSPRRVVVLLFVVAVLLAPAAMSAPARAASSATISFGTGDQPQYDVLGSDLVDDGAGCDTVTMLMTDPTGGIVDVDTFCIDFEASYGSDYTDWGSHESGYVPTTGPITYTLYDTVYGDACDAENSSECSDYLASGAVPCIAEAYYQPPSLPAGTANVVCGGGSAVAADGSCRLSIPVGSVVGDAPFATQAFWAPGKESNGVALNPGTYFVIGQDESETYYKVVLACQYVWVRKDGMQPSYQSPQNGTPLPTRIVQ